MAKRKNPLNGPPNSCWTQQKHPDVATIQTTSKEIVRTFVRKGAIEDKKKVNSPRDIERFVVWVYRVMSQGSPHLFKAHPALAAETEDEILKWAPCIKGRAPTPDACFMAPYQIYTARATNANKLLIEMNSNTFAPYDITVQPPLEGGFAEVGFIDRQGLRIPVYYGPYMDGRTPPQGTVAGSGWSDQQLDPEDFTIQSEDVSIGQSVDASEQGDNE